MTNEEQLKKIEEKLAVLQARKRELEAKEKDRVRKARTKRLIEIGASVESVFGREITKEELPQFMEWLRAKKERTE